MGESPSVAQVSTRKQRIRALSERLAPERAAWIERNSFYYDEDYRFTRFLVQPGQRVLDLGCGNGDLLHRLAPSRGVGVDFSAGAIAVASQRYPELEFVLGDVEDPERARAARRTLRLHRPLRHRRFARRRAGDAEQPPPALPPADPSGDQLLQPALGPGPPHRPAARAPDATARAELAVRPGHREHPDTGGLRRRPSRLTPVVATQGVRTRAPRQPLHRHAAGCSLSRAAQLRRRPIARRPAQRLAIRQRRSCRAATRRGTSPPQWSGPRRFCDDLEFIFVEGHSSDDTFEAVERVIETHPDVDIKLVRQDGIGKGDAVRKGFALARGDVLMILDADLTTPPEDLPKFYSADRRRDGASS